MWILANTFLWHNLWRFIWMRKKIWIIKNVFLNKSFLWDSLIIVLHSVPSLIAGWPPSIWTLFDSDQRETILSGSCMSILVYLLIKTFSFYQHSSFHPIFFIEWFFTILHICRLLKRVKDRQLFFALSLSAASFLPL